MLKRLFPLLLILVLLATPVPSLAQDYYFILETLTVDAYWNQDGTLSLDYTFVFQNDPAGHAIEYVDLGLPNNNFDVNSISASVDGAPVAYISESEFQGIGSSGVAVALGASSIPPGGRGTVRIFVGQVRQVLYTDTQDRNYASARFSPAYFQPSIIYGNTDLTVTFHLPPGVQPDEPRWHKAPAGFPEVPITGIDSQGRIFYSWRNPNANGHTRYEFGASFPKTYVPASAVAGVGMPSWLRNFDEDLLIPLGCCSSIALLVGLSIYQENRRKYQYLPPKISIEGHGIKRGLTAVEAAILLEQPLDKVLTMILFSVIKKGAAEVIQRDPLELKVVSPLPEGLHSYEKDFLQAFRETGSKRKTELRDTVVALVRSVSEKMKGFSRRETIAYYQDIVRRAWAQVESAETPEVKSQKFDEYMGWTMLDRNYDDRTREVFRHQPVFVPSWWGRYDPTFSSKTLARPTGTSPAPGGGQPALPHLPGSDFAASVVNGVQNFSSKVVGNINEFTSRVTSVTNPIPKSSSGRGSYRSSGGGSSCACACACACAGCACACAGGGR